MKFKTKLLQGGKTATGVEVPDEIVAKLASGARPKVKVTINGYTYRSSIARMGGRFMLGVSAEVRANAGVAGGDMFTVDLELDTAPREVAVPADFRKALDRNKKAARRFDQLPYSHKQRYVLSIDGAKTAETRQRRINKSVATLAEEA
jgi:hypothetical protein